MSAHLRFCRATRGNSGDLAEYALEFATAGEPYVVLPQNDPAALLSSIEKFELGEDLPQNRVRMTWFWLLRGDRIVASSRLRHELVAELMLDGGNIGYEVRPSERKQGLGREVLRRTLDQARCIGLRRVLLTTEPANVGSIAVILANGGVFADTCVSPNTAETLNRYWITL